MQLSYKFSSIAKPALLGALAALLLLSGCKDKRQFARAYAITNRSQAIGGQGAIGDAGDFMLENDQIRAVILGRGDSAGPGLFGGSLADLDLQRPEGEFRNGTGRDMLSEIFPTVNLTIPNTDMYGANGKIEIIANGKDGKAAIIRITGGGDNYMTVLGLVTSFLRGQLIIQQDYILEPGKRYIKIETTAILEGGGARAEMEPVKGGLELFRILLGDDQFPGHDELDMGVLAGDFLFMGRKGKLFTPGQGFDPEAEIRNNFRMGEDIMGKPASFDLLATASDGVSYAYFTKGGKVIMPIFASGLTVAFTHILKCEKSSPKRGCGHGATLKYTRYVSVGDGDVASALKPYYEINNIATATISGRVLDRRTSSPLRHIEVYAVKNPHGSCAAAPNYGSIQQVMSANRGDPRAPAAPGIVTHLRSDVGVRPGATGYFSGPIAPGSYYISAKIKSHSSSPPICVDLAAGEKKHVILTMPSTGTLSYSLYDERGTLIPAKLTIGQCLVACASDGDCRTGTKCDTSSMQCVPANGCTKDEQCAPDMVCKGGNCVCNPINKPDLNLGEGLYPDGVSKVVFNSTGRGTFQLPAGRHQVIVSRGFEYSIDRQYVTILPGKTTSLTGHVERVVDTRGWVAGDFHVHGQNSYDAAISYKDRVKSMVNEGIELLTGTDHDVLTDYGPTIRDLNLQAWIKSQVGNELTTLEYGHFLGFPLRYDNYSATSAGATVWTEGTKYAGYAVPHMTPTEMFKGLREKGLYGPENTVVVVPHPRDSFFGYFDQYGLNPFDLSDRVTALDRPETALASFILDRNNFSDGFDAIELFNAKRFDFIRTPAIGEMEQYRMELEELRNRPGLPMSEYERLEKEIATKWTKKIITRTPVEQERIMRYRKGTDCSPKICKENADCPSERRCIKQGGQSVGWCLIKCTTNTDCELNEKVSNHTCNPVYLVCQAPADDPCSRVEGVIDDWFRMLNYGIVKTGMGNSDTHHLVKVESGLPRTWVRSSTDAPYGIDRLEIVNSLKQGRAIASYGPFVELWVNDGEIGSMVKAPDGRARVRVKVQSPLWFDVDRVELYRNGKLIKEWELDMPNQTVVNLDAEYIDLPWQDQPGVDAWYVAIAMGTKGKTMSPVYTSLPFPAIQMIDITMRAFQSIPMLGQFLTVAMVPRVYPIFPMAITNPVRVDMNNNGEFDGPEGKNFFDVERAQALSQPLSSKNRGNHTLRPGQDRTAAERVRLLRYNLFNALKKRQPR